MSLRPEFRDPEQNLAMESIVENGEESRGRFAEELQLLRLGRVTADKGDLDKDPH